VRHNYLHMLVSIAFSFYQCGINAQQNYELKVKGLLYGTLIGDAFGGPIEFQDVNDVNKTPYPVKIWKTEDTINEVEIQLLHDRFVIRPYVYLKPVPETYGVWSYNALPGSITDDSRNKIVLMHMLRKKLKKCKKQFGEKDLANAYVDWLSPTLKKSHLLYDSLNNDWTKEIKFASNWVNGKRDSTARPPERMWNGLPTCWGQMTTTPLAAIYAGDPIKSYLLAYNVSFFDNASARDMNAALVAGISKAMALDPSKMTHEALWKEIISTMQNTDPYRYQDVPWCSRAINKWLSLADTFATQAKGNPKHLFDRLNREFYNNEKWEAQVVVGVIFSILKMCHYDPMAAMQMSIEWGWDTDTYPQLLGAFIGAIYGEQIFKQEWKSLIKDRLKLDYNEDVDEWYQLILKYNLSGKKPKIIWKER
jgi:ADP-ribosylglycohydrolase